MLTFSGLNTGLLIGRLDKFISLELFSVPHPVIEVRAYWAMSVVLQREKGNP